MPNDAPKFTPTEQEILIALYCWQHDPPARLTRRHSKFWPYFYPIPVVPYLYLATEHPQRIDSKLRNALQTLDTLGHVEVLFCYYSDPTEDGADRGYVDLEACLGLFRLHNGQCMSAGTSEDVLADAIRAGAMSDVCAWTRSMLEGDCYVLSSTGMLVARELWFADEGQRLRNLRAGAKRPSSQWPPSGHVAVTTIQHDDRYKKNGTNPARTSILRWEDRGSVTKLYHPKSNEVAYPDDWVSKHWNAWSPRQPKT